jgi:hypothetical protein
MRSNFYKIFAICAFMALSFNSLAQGNHYYSNNTLHDPYGKFQLNFPEEPKYSSQDIDIAGGSVRMYQFMYETANSVLMVSYVDYPESQIAGQDMDALLKKAAGGFIGQLKLTSKSETIINYGVNKGILFYADNGSMYTVMRDYIVKNRLYQVGILQYGAVDIKVENEFFDSFVLQ